MRDPNKERKLEQELRDALAELPQSANTVELCPNLDTLKRFFNGSLHEKEGRERVLVHLEHCSKCARALVGFRIRKRRLRSMLAIAAAILFAAATWLLMKRNEVLPRSTDYAVVDLRESALTRGLDNQPISLNRSAHELLVILPVASFVGDYEIGIRKAMDHPSILHSSAVAVHHGDHLELEAHLDLEKLTPGNYFLEVRHDDSTGEYYPLKIK
ncbi:MAG: hypothetical protein JWQ87_5289 [Candidatus Sulfotelmatobacter sp.]|nr:hypothetical protein [Candidatus Sulfotelmatobacter sp.]